MKTFIFVLLFLIPGLSQARLILDIVIVHKRGIDKNMVLQSELHSREEVIENKKIILFKSGLEIELEAKFNSPSSQYGPVAEVLIEGALTDIKGNVLKEIAGQEGIIRLNEERKLFYKGDHGQLIEITLKPYTL
ncbi:MAG: hypothetical protein KC493_12920 [Bacteriovoracaceae bacterium]|nr:hypothetical protein [Bacteriovoracaceae bacterium]